MNSGFATLTVSRSPAGLTVPDALLRLFEWVERQGFVQEGADGELYGSLSADYPSRSGTSLLLRGWRDTEIEGLEPWFRASPEGQSPLWPFCRTGADGSIAALWRSPDGMTRIVHLGSGSGSLLACVLGCTAVDFLRLLAIGYDEICWGENWHSPPAPEPGRDPRNEPYRRWVTSSFGVSIPGTGLEVVPAPTEMGDAGTDDVWCNFVNAHL